MTARIPYHLTDREYRQAERTLSEIEVCGQDLRDEIAYDGVEVAFTGDVFLTLDGERVARCQMSSRHADAHLIVEEA